MPNKDGTGPLGQGAKTGRQEGHCQGTTPIARGQGRGRGCGCRQGVMGKGRGCQK